VNAARGKAGDVNLRTGDLDAAATLDGINAKAADSNVVQLRSPAM
jgi:hypothetical protein